jgi:hypothetical protein
VRFSRLRKSLLSFSSFIFFASFAVSIAYIALAFEWSVLGMFVYPERTVPYAVMDMCFFGHAIGTYVYLHELYEKLSKAILEGIHALATEAETMVKDHKTGEVTAEANKAASLFVHSTDEPEETLVADFTGSQEQQRWPTGDGTEGLRVHPDPASSRPATAAAPELLAELDSHDALSNKVKLATNVTPNEVRQLLNSYNISDMTILGVVVYSSILLACFLFFITLGYVAVAGGKVSTSGAAVASTFMAIITAIVNKNTRLCIPKIGTGDEAMFKMVVEEFVQIWKARKFENDNSGRFIYNEEGEATDILRKADTYYKDRDVTEAMATSSANPPTSPKSPKSTTEVIQ